jgi:hypothetical protein
MKQLLAAAFLLLSAALASAIELKDLKGNWVGPHIEIYKGQVAAFASTFSGTGPASGESLQVVETTTFPRSIVATYSFLPNGTFAMTAIESGTVVISSYFGSWKAKKGKITIAGVGTGGHLKATITGTASTFQVKGKFGKSKVTISANQMP